MNKWLDGKKTWIGGIGIILTALGGLCAAIVSHGFDVADLLVALKLSLGGLVALGLGGKLQKLIEAFNSSK